MVAQNLPGAGGVRLLEYLVSQAPKDGTAPAAFASGPLVEQLVGPRKPAYGIADFAAIGSLEKDVAFCTTWHTSPAKTPEEAKRTVVTVAGTGAGSGTDTDPAVLTRS